MYAKENDVKLIRGKGIKDAVSYVRNHPKLSTEELMERTGESRFFIETVREVDNDPALQRGAGNVNSRWREQDQGAI